MNETTIYDEMLKDLYETRTFDCKKYCHPGESCLKYSLGFFLPVFKISWKYYFPIHFIPGLYFARKTLKENPKKFIITILKASLRSTMFMTMLQIFIQYFTCYFNKQRRYDGFNGFLGSFFAGVSLLIEGVGRREELSLFVVPNLYEVFFAFLKKRNIFKYLDKNYNLIYAIAIAILVNQYNGQKTTIKNTYRKMFQLLWGDL